MNEGYVIAAISWVVSLIAFSWTLGKKYGELKAGIDKNHRDINDACQSLRTYVKNKDYIIESQLKHIQFHLSKQTDYEPPTFSEYDH